MSTLPSNNPILNGIGLTDPHIVIHQDRAYLFATHDYSPDNQNFVMKDWWLWSSSDLVHWRQESILRPEDTFLKRPFGDCWATFGAFRNNRVYWYFSAGPTEIGVVTAESPAGPWTDPLGKPLIPRGLTPTDQRDPDLLIDDDGEAYLVFGTWEYYIVRLGKDMISLAESPRPLVLDRKIGPYGEGKTDDKPSLHKRNGLYYLSWSSFYATSTSVYGPYTYRGTVIETELVDSEFQGIANLRHDRHGNFFTWNNQWFYAFNDKGRPGRGEFFRDSCLAYVHYRDDGSMEPIRLDSVGVGQYDLSLGPIQARDFFASGPSFLAYPKTHGLKLNATMVFQVASQNPLGADLEIREGSLDGELLGRVHIPQSDHPGQYKSVECRLTNTARPYDLWLVCRAGWKDNLKIQTFS